MTDEITKVAGSAASKTVIVGCKLPHGLLLRVFDMQETTIDVIGGGKRAIKEAVRADDVSDVVKINGYAAPHGQHPDHPLVGGRTGYALTFGVPREFFEKWLDQNKSTPMVREGLIFAAGSEQAARDKAKEMKGVVNGLEPLDPKNLPKLSRRLKIEKYNKDDARAA